MNYTVIFKGGRIEHVSAMTAGQAKHLAVREALRQARRAGLQEDYASISESVSSVYPTHKANLEQHQDE